MAPQNGDILDKAWARSRHNPRTRQCAATSALSGQHIPQRRFQVGRGNTGVISAVTRRVAAIVSPTRGDANIAD